MLLTGASGGVGHYFVELAAAQGADSDRGQLVAERAERLLDLGAQRVVTDVEQAAGVFDLALDSVGGPSRRPGPRPSRRRKAVLVWFGQASRTARTIDFFDWTGGANATIRKFHYAESDVTLADDLATLVRLVEGCRLHPEVARDRRLDPHR